MTFSHAHSKPSILNYLQEQKKLLKDGNSSGTSRGEEKNIKERVSQNPSNASQPEAYHVSNEDGSYRGRQKRTWQSTDFGINHSHQRGRGRGHFNSRSTMSSHHNNSNDHSYKGRGREYRRDQSSAAGNLHNINLNHTNTLPLNNNIKFSVSNNSSSQNDIISPEAVVRADSISSLSQVNEHKNANNTPEDDSQKKREKDTSHCYFSSDDEDTGRIPFNREDITRKIESYNSKLIVVTSSIASLTRERSALMKKIQKCEDLLSDNSKNQQAQERSLQPQQSQKKTSQQQSLPSSNSIEPPRILTQASDNDNPSSANRAENTASCIITGKQIPFNPFISGRSWALQSCPDMQVIKSFQTQKVGKLNRKPRNLVLYPSHQFNHTSSTSLQDMVIIPTINSDIQLFDLRKQMEMPFIPKKTVFESGWAEEGSWVSPDTLAFSLHSNSAKSGPPGPSVDASGPDTGLTLLRNCNIDRYGKLQYDVSRFEKTPHTKMIMAIEPIQCASSSRFKFVTGGADKLIQLWSVDDSSYQKPYRDIKEPVCESLHQTHTSDVTCLYYDRTSSVLYSGGKDFRVVGFDVEKNQLVYGGKEMRSEFMIKEILPVSMQPKLLVIGGYQKINTSSDFNIFDIRSQQYVLKIMRGPSTGAYNRASIHKNGMLLTAGDTNHGIQIWDLRYIKVECEYQRLENVHAKKVISARFYESGFIPSSILSIGSDNELLLTDYERGVGNGSFEDADDIEADSGQDSSNLFYVARSFNPWDAVQEPLPIYQPKENDPPMYQLTTFGLECVEIDSGLFPSCEADIDTIMPYDYDTVVSSKNDFNEANDAAENTVSADTTIILDAEDHREHADF